MRKLLSVMILLLAACTPEREIATLQSESTTARGRIDAVEKELAATRSLAEQRGAEVTALRSELSAAVERIAAIEKDSASAKAPAQQGREVPSSLAVALPTEEYLTSDALKGREMGSEGEKAAADYVAGRFQQFGLTAEVQSFDKGVNVYGILPGKLEEAVVIGCHIDHLGVDKEGRICRGADDNASGVAAVLALAARMAEKPAKRTIVFCAFGGEEAGLIGSMYYAKHQARPAIAMINMDMVGRMTGRKLMVMATGTSDIWEPYLKEANLDGLDISLFGGGGVGRSDHTSFYAEGIPVIHLFTGFHEDYHKSTDTAEKINYRGMDYIVNLVERIARRVADAETKPKYIEVKEAAPQGRDQSDVTLGAMPDFNDKDHMVVGVLVPGGPAQKAGLKKGDIIIGFDGAEVKSLQDYSDKLKACKVGQEVTLKVKRGEEVLEVKATVGAKKK